MLIAVIVYLVWALVDNTIKNLAARKIASGFGFLGTTASFGINQTLIEYTEESSYGAVFIVGLLNTLLVSALGVFFATLIGFTIGVMRLSKNWVVAKIATVYVEVLRNIPLLLQIFFWYFAVLRAMPDKKDKASLFGTFHINVTGVWVPKPLPQDGFSVVVIALLAGIVATFVVRSWARKRQEATGQQFPVGWAALGLIVGLPVLAYFIMGSPLDWAYPEFRDTGSKLRRGFQLGTGMQIIPEFLALLAALSLYTATFIAEIV
ncbi:MAG TPA: amino acid ABC transporter permease, partial [Rhizobiales bacterium]|nr:amino acid ABC transporter permease [Hyphomicrobiales bacterium]